MAKEPTLNAGIVGISIKAVNNRNTTGYFICQSAIRIINAVIVVDITGKSPISNSEYLGKSDVHKNLTE